jgi:hypothetical protein
MPKRCSDPCFPFNDAKLFIKLKKDYVDSLGDTADFAIAGHRNAKDEQELDIENLWWISCDRLATICSTGSYCITREEYSREEGRKRTRA